MIYIMLSRLIAAWSPGHLELVSLLDNRTHSYSDCVHYWTHNPSSSLLVYALSYQLCHKLLKYICLIQNSHDARFEIAYKICMCFLLHLYLIGVWFGEDQRTKFRNTHA
jgi:hypothetical protein